MRVAAAPGPPLLPARAQRSAVLRHGVISRPVGGVADGDRAICWALYAFVFSLPFETIPLGVPATPSKLLGGVLLLVALSRTGLAFAHRSVALGAFAGYVAVFAVLALPYASAYQGELFVRFTTLLQMLVLFWLAQNLLSFADIADRAFLCLGVSCVSLSGLLMLGLATNPIAYYQVTRISAFEGNPNELATVLGAGLVSLVSLAGSRASRKSYLMLAPAFIVVVSAIVQTGSRSGLLAFLAGLLMCVFGQRSAVRRTRVLMVFCLGLGATTLLVINSEAALFRWRAVVDRGDTAHRQQLVSEAWQMFVEAPVFGWGPVNNTYVLGNRTIHATGQGVTDPHNLGVSILTESGIVGAVPFFLGLGLCLRGAWRARASGRSVLPLALMSLMLVMCSTGVWQYRKLFWLVLGYAIAAGAPGLVAPREPVRRCRIVGRTARLGSRPGL